MWKHDTSVPWPMASGSRCGARLVCSPYGTFSLPFSLTELVKTCLFHYKMLHKSTLDYGLVDIPHSDPVLIRRK